MVGSAGTRQPAESRSQACRRACPAHDAGVHLRPRLGPTNSLSLGRARTRAAGRGEEGGGEWGQREVQRVNLNLT